MLNIAARILKQVIRDKRTLMLLLVAPLFILTLIYFLFNYSDETTDLKVGTIQLNKEIDNKLHDLNIDTIKYSNNNHLEDKFKDDQLDGFIVGKNDKLNITYENSDPSVTTQLQMKINQLKINQNLKQLSSAITAQGKIINNITAQLPPQIKEKMHHQEKPTVHKLETTSHYLHGDKDTNYFDTISPILISFFVFFFTFLISGISLLKERTSGTLERTLSSPIKKYEIILGYIIGYGTFAIIQTTLIVIYSIYVLQMVSEGNIALVFVTNILVSFIALTLGLLLSTYASSEFQMIQFIPIIVIPQIFFAGIIPVDTMHKVLQYIAHIMPLFYAADANQNVMLRGFNISDIYIDWIILFAIFILLLILNIFGMSRYRKV
ncbi:ABC transporter permease [Mammaliicoccus stepanovicii]|uniref:ABC transporter, permease protein n=1 Tax=Mammaliicoccus stepanovicii TaxID=643214 RepID=A0A239ZRI8_9STAP|nr:ABC transporter permease [Mammaliicoccus stepanovicii]PNZ74329.1 ABC transporter permease [Mammaliicoccus stepanovicii]GGI38791.1 ABC transporter permease [Mammaliicoccus stepanovicii]SNV73831.1 ABC transporter, permease protein [Mammaliicoccus stepanovicii]